MCPAPNATPNGRASPSANTCRSSAVPSPLVSRSTVSVWLSESVAKTSPPGATATQRIRLKPPSAKTFAEKPFGTVSVAPAGCATTVGGFRTSGVANGLGSVSGFT